MVDVKTFEVAATLITLPFGSWNYLC